LLFARTNITAKLELPILTRVLVTDCWPIAISIQRLSPLQGEGRQT
jgi:hypothetical protein